MSIKDTFKHLRAVLADVTSDLDKAESGNKAASQRVRTGTIKLEKIAKLFRKESVKAERGGSSKKKKSAPAKSASKAAPKKAAKVKTKKATASAKKVVKKKATAKILKKR